MPRTWRAPRRSRSMPSPSGAALPCCALIIRAPGQASGRFEDGTLALWLEESLAAIDALTSGPLVLVGLVHGRLDRLARRAAPARTRPGAGRNRRGARLHRLGLHRRAEGELHAADVSKCRIRTGPSRHSSLSFWQSGQDLRLLDREIAIDCPVRLAPRRPGCGACRSTSRSGPCARSVQPMSS